MVLLSLGESNMGETPDEPLNISDAEYKAGVAAEEEQKKSPSEEKPAEETTDAEEEKKAPEDPTVA
jgi:hypothetical protein